jgi:hypothetical protein
MFQVIDTLRECRVVETFETWRKAFNYSCRLEPKPSLQGTWRYRVRPVAPRSGANTALRAVFQQGD